MKDVIQFLIHQFDQITLPPVDKKPSRWNFFRYFFLFFLLLLAAAGAFSL